MFGADSDYEESDACRFQWRPKLISLLTAIAFALSIYSSLDCRMMTVDFGFTPESYSDNVIDLGLWTFESPDGTCVSHRDALQQYSWVVSAKSKSWFVNADVSWTTSRIFAFTSLLFAAMSLMIGIRNSCSSEPSLLDLLIYTSINALLCEASKLGLFFHSNLCMSPNYWYNSYTDSFSHTEDCSLGTSALLCIGSITLYSLSITLSVGYAFRPAFSEDDVADYYDEKSLQSWMHNGSLFNQPEGSHQQTQEETTMTEHCDVLEISERSGSVLRRAETILDEDGDFSGASIIRPPCYGRKMDEISAVSWDEYY